MPAMLLINKYIKLSSYMTSMPINDRPLIKLIMLISFSPANFLLMHLSSNVKKINLGFGRRRYKLLQ